MKKLTIILSFLILTSTTFATSVGGSIGGWNIVSQVGSGIGQKLTATKEVMVNGASKVITGTANVIPNASSTARFMARVGGVALVVDAMDLVLDGVDYVMDPANNTLTYNTKPKVPVSDGFTDDTDKYKSQYKYFFNTDGKTFTAYHGSTVCQMYFTWWNTQQSALRYSFTSMKSDAVCLASSVTLHTGYVDNNVTQSIGRVVNPNLGSIPDEESKRITIPLSDISSQVIEQAEQDIRAGKPASPAVALSRAVAEAQAKEAELDDKKAQPIVDQFQKNHEYPSVNEGEGTITTPEITDPITGEVTPPQTSSISMKFPKACDWFPQACEFIDWMKTDPNLDSEMEIPEKELEKQEIKDDLVKISSGRCPMDARLTLNELPFGMKVNKSYSYQEICNTVEPMKYVFKLITIIFCVLILVRV